ncbi:hypothetical protein KEM52_001757 [Ascosphaera acerosa]|nr:hypothetical protein KEM52_001757 [Ascosphaera acerosa]
MSPYDHAQQSSDDRRSPRAPAPAETGPYVLREVIQDAPVATEAVPDAAITCVEFWDGNLYIGTSAGEILHYVLLPSDDGGDGAQESPSWMIASRLPIIGSDGDATSACQGVQQILLVPAANKACVLCNGMVTFYELPELSPTYRGMKVPHCTWIGEVTETDETQSGDVLAPAIMIAMEKKIILVRVGDEPKKLRNIEFPACLTAARQESIACVADAHMYSLLELDYKQKISLFPISSVGGLESPTQDEQQEASVASSELLTPATRARGHSRSSSTNSAAILSPAPSPVLQAQRDVAHVSGADESTTVSEDPIDADTPHPPPKPTLLKPHIISPTSTEFLLLTGTSPDEPGVGVFVNLEGEVIRGTLDFSRYPVAVVVDNDHYADGNGTNFVLAAVEYMDETGPSLRIEAQRWDTNPGEGERHKDYLPIDRLAAPGQSQSGGLHHTASATTVTFQQMSNALQLVRIRVPPGTPPDGERSDSMDSIIMADPRDEQELRLAHGLSRAESDIMLWSGCRLRRLVRNPKVLQLEHTLATAAGPKEATETASEASWDPDALIAFILSLDDIEPRTESEFIGLGYMKQKANLLLFAHVLRHTEVPADDLVVAAEKGLIDSGVDPRLVLLCVPLLREDVLVGSQGLWIYKGLTPIAQPLLQPEYANATTQDSLVPAHVLQLLRRYLLAWQQKRGYGSITDESHVSDSVDAALLHVLLELDHRFLQTASRPVGRPPMRHDLYKAVDTWAGDFDRARGLLERYRRLFVLSRLYQSRKMARQVLKTWRRIAEGETDAGGEFAGDTVDQQFRKYLVKLRDETLVEEYSIWLAARNPKLAVDVLCDDQSRVKFDPTATISLLKERAPTAVQDYLERLVFAQRYYEYADDLIAYYLDTVLSVLESSPEAQQSLADSYSTYRALQPPKPSYLSFITHNCPDDPWWQSRLRLLQLLGGSSTSRYSAQASQQLANISYSIPTVLSRIEPFKHILVSESILLGGRQGKHEEALHLLVHGLGDYDTAIRYCLLGSPLSSTSLYKDKSAHPGAPAQTDSSTASQQRRLFAHLLTEFLAIQDPDERVQRTADLLERFAPMYEVHQVLEVMPESWSVSNLDGYFTRVLRALAVRAHEAQIHRSLSAAAFLRADVERIDRLRASDCCYIEDDNGIESLAHAREKVLAEPTFRLDDGAPIE